MYPFSPRTRGSGEGGDAEGERNGPEQKKTYHGLHDPESKEEEKQPRKPERGFAMPWGNDRYMACGGRSLNLEREPKGA